MALPRFGSQRQQQLLDFLQSRPGVFLHQARKFAAERDEIVAFSCTCRLAAG